MAIETNINQVLAVQIESIVGNGHVQGWCTEEGLQNFQKEIICEDLVELSMLIGSMRWVLLVNQTDIPFWTSDHPVVLHNRLIATDRGTLGLTCRGIELYCPLTPKLCLFLCDPLDNVRFPRDLTVTCESTVNFQNDLQVAWSTRHIFSSEENFSRANQIIDMYPHLGDLDKPRFVVDLLADFGEYGTIKSFLPHPYLRDIIERS
jgi:hypothetical protein